ncbi:hypothetical protein [uncultured Christiangramia sp.]|uniref:hypothetical protein n=1 Tax=Christiangramia sp. 3-2217-3z TaxID=3417564 RepID=UPI002629534D|nr:hypothetical protein [uncultured Christiangramia sp.]
MNLVNISKEENCYKIKSVKYVKVFGTTLYSYDKIFVKQTESNQWINKNTNKEATQAESLKLDKWLKDHQKFIEKG